MNNSLEGTNENNTQIKQQRELDNTADEAPLVIMKQGKGLSYAMLMVLLVILFYLFGVLLPVITTGKSTAIWASKTSWDVTRIVLFYSSMIAIPLCCIFLILLVRVIGTFHFYDDRLVLETRFFPRKVIIPYNKMHVIQSPTGIVITTKNLDDCSTSLQRFRVRFWEGVSFGTTFEDPEIGGIKRGSANLSWENPEDGPKAIQILKVKAFSFKRV